jgi:peptidoglycan/LPS O-acetylase OafA/YrhL
MLAAGSAGGVERYRSLDGLRGVAALVVVAHHSLLVVPGIADVYTGYVPPRGSLTWLLTYSPARILWAGDIAVWVFFILSGFVLTLPWTSGRTGGSRAWVGYYVARLPRLYLPVWASLLVAWGLSHIASWHADGLATWWLNGNGQPATLRTVMHGAALVRNVPSVNQPLWSLSWEVAFSVLLPLFVIVLGVRLWWPIKIALLMAIMLSGHGPLAVFYLPLFGIGVVAARHRQSIRELQRWAPRGPAGDAAWVVALVGAAVAADLSWALTGQGWTLEHHVTGALTILGVCLIFEAAMQWRVARAVLESAAGQWLGRRSFSLYLVHYPVVVSIAMLLGPAHDRVVWLLAIPTALVAADLFFRVAEAPSHRLSQMVYRRVVSRPPGGISQTTTGRAPAASGASEDNVKR